ncbi:GATA transcription factor 20 [Zea mays]|uniref:GATA transcription factor 20 n=2 Tax=Zea mays TaxID=4577 RepID=A0A8J8YKU1_MAIZE|nr:GATA transcription factor 19 [Zea mays]PWZ08498.1 GATA transcription factor 20 [Zea mays]
MLQKELPRCACGDRSAAPPAFSLLFPKPMGLPAEQWYCYHEEGGASPYGAASTPIDCTLSLGTPSTRRAESAGVGVAAALMEEPRQGSPPRRCANCDTTSTPLWRNGPRGPKSLCNACGIRYKKEERRRRTSAAGTLDRRAPPQQQWGCYGPGAGKSAASYGMYDGDVGVVAVDGPCLSWMLEVVPSSPAFAARERRTLSPYY